LTDSAPRPLLEGLGFPESIRWHEGRAWLCNWGAGEVLAVDHEGRAEVMARVAQAALPFSIDWLPDGTLLIVDGPRRLLLAQRPDGSLETVADLSVFGEAPFNELVVDDRGNAYVNGGPGLVARVGADGGVHREASGLGFPNGMALVDDGGTLVVADSQARQLIGFAVASDGSLADRHVWAELQHAPDGICVDDEGAVWVASVPGQYCVRVRQGGEVLDTVAIDRGCFACMLGGEDGRTLFMMTAAAPTASEQRTGHILVTEVAVPGAGPR
jgi:sugar lactone lactonase YvrE